MNIRKTIGPILLLSWALASFAEKEPVIVMTPTDRSSNVSDMWSDEEGATNSNTSISPVTENTVVPVAPVKVEASSKQSSKHKAHSPMTTHYYGPTTSKDNIWEIAKKFRPNSSVTIAQVAIALQQANPGAFTANNINGLKIGQKLRVPTLAAMHRMTPTEAQTMIDKQNLAWKNSSTKKTAAPAKLATHTSSTPTANTDNTAEPLITPISTSTASIMIEKPAATVAVADDNTAPETKPVNTAATLPTTPTTTVTQPAIKPAITTNNGSNPINHAPGIDAHANAAPIPAATPAVVKVVDNNGLLPLQTEVKHIQQTVSTYQQETEARLVQLSQQNTTTQNRISHIETTLNHINQQLNKITDPAVAVTASKPEAIPTKVNFISAPLSHHQKSVLQHLVAKWWIIALAILVLLLVWIPWPDKKTVKKRPQSQPNKVIEEDEESEYDYLSSHEAIPAKLDLARAYIDMDDIESATRVLQEVILQGNDSQRHQAKQLLGTIRPHLV